MDLPVNLSAVRQPPGLDARSAAVLREIVEQYVETGEPVGSRTLSRRLPMTLSPATAWIAAKTMNTPTGLRSQICR